MRLKLTIALSTLLVVTAVGLDAQEQVYEPGAGVASPRPVREVKPQYTPRAMQEKVQGTVWLKCVVRTDGKASDIEITKELHPELDQASIEALQQWEFKPGTRDGKPVPVRVTVEMTFTLKQ